MDTGRKLTGLRRFLRPEVLIWVLLLLLLAERLWLFRELGVEYMSHSDDDAYIESGLFFARTGVISMWVPYPSAMIMPAMPVVIGLFSKLFGSGPALKLALKLLWILLGVATAGLCYRAVSLRASKWAGLLSAALFLTPNMAWMNHVLLTETPYLFFFTLCVYETLRMERSGKKRCFAIYLLSFLAALMFRSNAVTLPLFTGAYLLLRRQDRRLLLRRALVLLTALLLFVVPWSIRNYRQFGAFAPLSYGAGNPLLLGTYQGEGFPADQELDYVANVDAVMAERYAAYYKAEPEPWPEERGDDILVRYDPEGKVKEPRHAQYLSLQADGIKARYRLREWWANNPVSLLKSYLLIKPRWMLNWSWAWEEMMGVPYQTLHRLSQLNFLFCILTVVLSLARKRYRPEVLFLTGLYFALVYIHALAFVSDRYASTLIGLRYLLAGYGASLLLELILDTHKMLKKHFIAP